MVFYVGRSHYIRLCWVVHFVVVGVVQASTVEVCLLLSLTFHALVHIFGTQSSDRVKYHMDSLGVSICSLIMGTKILRASIYRSCNTPHTHFKANHTHTHATYILIGFTSFSIYFSSPFFVRAHTNIFEM